MHAHLEGGKLVSTLASQATALRESAHQRSRAKIRRLPIKLVPMFVIFLMPALFVLALLPAGYSLAHIG
jgi:pilus assembly protein TadC